MLSDDDNKRQSRILQTEFDGARLDGAAGSLQSALMSYDFRSPRLFVRGDLSAGIALQLQREQEHYLLNVLRLGNGDAILVFNGRNGEWRAQIAKAGRKGCALKVVEQVRAQSPLPD